MGSMGGFEQKKYQFQRLNQEIEKDTALSHLVCLLWYSFLRKKGSTVEAQTVSQRCLIYSFQLFYSVRVIISVPCCENMLISSLSLKPQVLIIQSTLAISNLGSLEAWQSQHVPKFGHYSLQPFPILPPYVLGELMPLSTQSSRTEFSRSLSLLPGLSLQTLPNLETTGLINIQEFTLQI